MDRMQSRIKSAGGRMSEASLSSPDFAGINASNAPSSYRNQAPAPAPTPAPQQANYTVEVPVYLDRYEIARATVDDLSKLLAQKTKAAAMRKGHRSISGY